MPTLTLKPTHKPVREYYTALDRYAQLGVTHETAVRSAFQFLLESCGRQFDWTLVPEHSIQIGKERRSAFPTHSLSDPPDKGEAKGVTRDVGQNRRIVVDGALMDSFRLIHGYWEAKDIHDDLPAEIGRKFEKGYPRDNILFQTPHRAILWQNNQQTLDADLTDPKQLIKVLNTFFSHRPPEYTEWEDAVAQFKDRVPDIGSGLADLIQEEREVNPHFVAAFRTFHEKCCQSINPNLSEAAVEEMLIQHLLTERIFRTVFNNPDFTRRNLIANEIENVIDALTEQSFSRDDFLHSLDPFYTAIERTAETINDFSQKQGFLNTVYEQFFQGFSVEVADTHGIVYTPQPIVDFMVKSVDEILKTEFENRHSLTPSEPSPPPAAHPGKSRSEDSDESDDAPPTRGDDISSTKDAPPPACGGIKGGCPTISDRDVHIIDPFVGTGNFIVRVMREIRRTALENKYQSELHCNEVMLLPYYIASMNIEHEFYESIGRYQPFRGICLVDTFELAEDTRYYEASLFTEENTRRVEEQKATPMFVIIGNPPYNVGQVNENDNNKNRKYPTMDARVKDTYSQDSTATNKNALADPYIKAIRWASDRIEDEGIVAFVTNNGFLDGVAFDGMRKHLADDFDAIYILDLGGNARKGLKVSDANVFGIRVGVSINLFVKNGGAINRPTSCGRGIPAPIGTSDINRLTTNEDSPVPARIFYYRTDDLWNKKQKFDFLNERGHVGNIDWQTLHPDTRYTWLTEGLHTEFETFIPMGTKEVKEERSEAVDVIFQTYSNGVKTNRDAWAYNFNRNTLTENISRMIDTYNEQVFKWERLINRDVNVDEFVINDNAKISWSETLKRSLQRGKTANFSQDEIRVSLYRPFAKSNLYFNRMITERVYVFPSIFPTPGTEMENQAICVVGYGRKEFAVLMSKSITDVNLYGDPQQSFPFYTYDEDGGNRRENITDWALEQFREHYQDKAITKWDIFHYVYALLHHPTYRKRYQANLKRDLPHLPYTPDFWEFAKAGQRLGKIHVNYEDVDEYPLAFIENSEGPLNPSPRLRGRGLWRVEKMRLSKDKTGIKYNDFLTLEGIPAKVFDYRLGNRSALEWVIDQYRVKTDKRSGIVNDPNRPDDPEYIVRLIGKVITVSLETVEIVEKLADVNIRDET